MRVGQNPEKSKGDKNTAYYHRVIIPVYIPNVTEDYFKNSLEVFKVSLNSLLESINVDNTAITIINNNSLDALEEFIFSKGRLIDKYVRYTENKGKVYAVMQELKSVFEPFFTIADSDIYFVKGWEKAVFDIYKNFPKAGTVAPIPCQNLSLKYCNTTFVDNYFFRRLKYGKVVSDKDCDLYLEGIGNLSMHNRYNRKFNWRKKQYYITKNNINAIIGSGHFVATHKTEMFSQSVAFPEHKFLVGYEEQFIDVMADKNNLYRLSTQKLYAYHIGNRLDHNIKYLDTLKGLMFNSSEYKGIEFRAKEKINVYIVKRFIFKLLYKFLKF